MPFVPMLMILWSRVMSTTSLVVVPEPQVSVIPASVWSAVPLSVTVQRRGTFWARRTPSAWFFSSQATSFFR